MKAAIYGTTCYLSQQIAEKYLKGFLVYHGRAFGKIHDLVKLLNDCKKIDQDFAKLEDGCLLLNEYYIESRYPIDMPVNYTKQEAKEALVAAENIMNFISKMADYR